MVHIGGSAVGAAALGLVLGLVLCVGPLRVMRNTIYGVGICDAPTIFFVVLVPSIITLLATTIPALRVAARDPIQVLRKGIAKLLAIRTDSAGMLYRSNGAITSVVTDHG
jgi:hypothetical protein